MAERWRVIHVGQRIKDEREAAGLSQADLAERLGTTQTAISYWESGRRVLTVDSLIEIARVLNVAPSALLPDDDMPPADDAIGPRVTSGGVRHEWCPECRETAPHPGYLNVRVVRVEPGVLLVFVANEHGDQLTISGIGEPGDYEIQTTNPVRGQQPALKVAEPLAAEVAEYLVTIGNALAEAAAHAVQEPPPQPRNDRRGELMLPDDLNHHIVHVATRRRDSVEFWAITGLHAGRTIRRLRVFATGQPFPEHLSYVGTAITPDGTLVWHLMEDPGGSE